MIRKIICHGRVELNVYKNKGVMRRSVKKFGYKVEGLEAIVIPCDVIGVDGKKTKIKVLMYLHDDINLPVLAHECLHVATALIRAGGFGKRLRLSGRNINKDEEFLAYTMTMVMEEVMKVKVFRGVSDYKFTDEMIKEWANHSV